MAEPSHRSTTSDTPSASVHADRAADRAADLLTSRDLEVTHAETDGNPDRPAREATPHPPATPSPSPPVDSTSRPRRARHAKVTGDDSPTIAFPPLTRTESPTAGVTDITTADTRTKDSAPEYTGTRNPRTGDTATPAGPLTDGAATDRPLDVADGWRILSSPRDDPPAAAPADGPTNPGVAPSATAQTSSPETMPPVGTDVPAASHRNDDTGAATAITVAPAGTAPAPAPESRSQPESETRSEPESETRPESDPQPESDARSGVRAAPSVVPPAIEVVALHKRFGDNVAVESVSFSVAKGSILALLGPNGAGKTTTVNMLCTLLKPDGGSATVAGHDVVSDAPGVRRSIMLTGQFAALDEALSGRDNLVLFGRLMGLSKSAARDRADELLTSFDLTHAAGRRVGEYSGGMRRRIDIACGLVTQPEVVFLDEPTTGLDPRSRQEVWKLVESLRDQGVTTLLTTQYLEEADTLSDHIVVIDRGRVIASGTADELKTATGASHYDVTPTDPDDLPRLTTCLGDLLTEPPIGDTDRNPTGSVAVPAPDGADTLVEIVHRTTGAGIRLSDVALRRPSLDEVFLALTDPSTATSAPSTESADDPA